VTKFSARPGSTALCQLGQWILISGARIISTNILFINIYLFLFLSFYFYFRILFISFILFLTLFLFLSPTTPDLRLSPIQPIPLAQRPGRAAVRSLRVRFISRGEMTYGSG